MNINFNGNVMLQKCFNYIDEEFSLSSLHQEYDVVFIKSNCDKIIFNKDKSSLTIEYISHKDALFLLFKGLHNCLNQEELVINKGINKLTYMIDLSRNNVYKVSILKKLINYLVVLGYDNLGLYMEDTYEIKENEYFGKYRGRYSHEELKEIVEYAEAFEFEVEPYIQTLGHLSTLFDFPSNWKYLEHQDFLLLRSEDTYKFIELMFKNLKEVFKCKNIHVGMDEVTLLGRAKFLDEHGYIDKKELMKEHLGKVRMIAKKYDFNISIWSDMFFTSTSIYAYNDIKPVENLTLPDDINIVFWKYEKITPTKFDEIISAHKMITQNVSYAGGAWKWLGFAPNNLYSIDQINVTYNSCVKNKIQEYILTGWGDNGGETSSFMILPSLYHLGNLNSGFKDSDDEFNTLTGMSLNEFLSVDKLNYVPGSKLGNEINSFNRIFLYDDLLIGTYDQFIKEEQSKLYSKLSKVYDKYLDKKFGYAFKEYRDFARLLALKCEIITTLRKNYLDNDKEKLAGIIKKLKRLYKLYDVFISSFRDAWDKESKPQGFDVQDIRLGGAKERIRHTIIKLENYLNGKIDSIPELEEKRVDFYGCGTLFVDRKDLNECRVKALMTKNINY